MSATYGASSATLPRSSRWRPCVASATATSRALERRPSGADDLLREGKPPSSAPPGPAAAVGAVSGRRAARLRGGPNLLAAAQLTGADRGSVALRVDRRRDLPHALGSTAATRGSGPPDRLFPRRRAADPDRRGRALGIRAAGAAADLLARALRRALRARDRDGRRVQHVRG